MRALRDLHVRTATPEDESEWRGMWAGYIEFYQENIPEDVTVETWRRIQDPTAPFGTVVAENDDGVIGFANYVVVSYTWSDKPRCYMEDLFVKPQARGEGAGRALIEHLVEQCRREGWTDLFWMTHETNTTARRLYDQFAPASGFIQYSIEIDGGTN